MSSRLIFVQSTSIYGLFSRGGFIIEKASESMGLYFRGLTFGKMRLPRFCFVLFLERGWAYIRYAGERIDLLWGVYIFPVADSKRIWYHVRISSLNVSIGNSALNLSKKYG